VKGTGGHEIGWGPAGRVVVPDLCIRPARVGASNWPRVCPTCDVTNERAAWASA
jgi:hypothetical protein